MDTCVNWTECDAHHSSLPSAEVKMRGAVTPVPQYVFTAWCLVTRRQLYFYLGKEGISLNRVFEVCPASGRNEPMFRKISFRSRLRKGVPKLHFSRERQTDRQTDPCKPRRQTPPGIHRSAHGSVHSCHTRFSLQLLQRNKAFCNSFWKWNKQLIRNLTIFL
jgi:hypothetical protein